jgi:hypothetical protein
MTHARRLQVAGYKAVYYPGLTEDALEHCFLDMPVDLMHRSHTTPEHVCGVGERLIQKWSPNSAEGASVLAKSAGARASAPCSREGAHARSVKWDMSVWSVKCFLQPVPAVEAEERGGSANKQRRVKCQATLPNH